MVFRVFVKIQAKLQQHRGKKHNPETGRSHMLKQTDVTRQIRETVEHETNWGHTLKINRKQQG